MRHFLVRARVIGSVLGVMFALAPSLAAARPADESLPIGDVLQAPTLAPYSPPAFSPDGRYLAYVVTDHTRRREAADSDAIIRNGLAWYGIASDIWVVDLTNGEKRNVTGGSGHAWAPSWSPDGSQLAFLADRSGDPKLGPARLWVWERDRNAIRKASDADVREGYAGLAWTQDGSVVVSLFPQDLGRERYAAGMEGKAPPPGEGAPAPGVTVKVFEFDSSVPGAVPMTDQVNLDFFRRDLALVDVLTGKLRSFATRSRISHSQVSPDRRRIAYSVLRRVEKPGTGQYLFDLVVQDLPGGAPRVAAADIPFELMGTSFRFSPTGDRIAWRTGGSTAEDEVHVVPTGGGSARRIARNPATERGRNDVGPPIWDDAGRNVFFLRDGVLWKAPADGSSPAAAFARPSDWEINLVDLRQSRLFSIDAGRSAAVWISNPRTKRAGMAKVDLSTGAVTPIFEEDKRYGGYGTEPAISADGRSVVYVAEDAANPPDLYIRTGDLREARRVSEVAPALANRTLGRAEVIEWKTLDGEAQRGALVYPAGYEKGKRYPLIVKVYGGSSISNDLNRFGYASAAFENLQIYATRGYALLLADSKLNLGSPMVDLMKSVMPGVEKAIESGLADPDRIGITGHSYGGYSTLSLIVQSSRFKAAVMRAGMGDMFAQYGQLAPDGTNYGLAWAESGQGRMGGNPWEYRERYLENSPSMYLDRVQTPLLIIHGSKDDAVPVFLADSVFTGLRRLGKSVAYARYEGETHWEGTWSYPNQLDALERTIGWFDRYLKAPTPPAAEEAAGKAGS